MIQGFPKKKGLSTGEDFDKLSDCEYALKTEQNIGFDKAIDDCESAVMKMLDKEKIEEIVCPDNRSDTCLDHRNCEGLAQAFIDYIKGGI